MRPLLVFCLMVPIAVMAQDAEEGWWRPQGTVDAMVLDEGTNTLYMGGAFGIIKPPVPISHGAVCDTAVGMPLQMNGRPDGPVLKALPDGAGGWFIGGRFTAVDEQPRARAAHLHADGTLYPWAPDVDGALPWPDAPLVHDMELYGGRVFLGGNFHTLNGEPRRGLAAVDALTGANLEWMPKDTLGFPLIPLDEYPKVEFSRVGHMLYIGATHGQIGSTSSDGIIAAIDLQADTTLWSRELSPWLTSGFYTSESIDDIDVLGNSLYVAGLFSGSVPDERYHLMALDRHTGDVLPFDANIAHAGSGRQVMDVAVYNDRVFMIGVFDTVGTVFQYNLAALDAVTGALLPWTPEHSEVGGQSSCIAVHEGSVYISAPGGLMEAEWSQGYPNYKFDAMTGELREWQFPFNNGFNTQANEFAFDGDRMYIGFVGDYAGLARPSACALDVATKRPTPWNPRVNGTVNTMALTNGRVYLGGSITDVGHQPRLNIAAVDKSTGALEAWTPEATGAVYSLLAQGGTIYVGGVFTAIGGASRNNLAALDATTGNATSWDPSPNGPAFALTLSGSTLYVGGSFSSIIAETRYNAAAFNTGSGSLLPWAPDPDGAVRCMAINGGDLYLGGDFTSLLGQPRSHMAAVDAVDASLRSFDPNADGTVNTIVFSNGLLYTGGFFSRVYNTPRSGLAALDPMTGEPTTWAPVGNGSINAILATTKIFTGGALSGTDPAFSVLPPSTTTPAPSLRIKAFLGGPYVASSGLMLDSLRAKGSLPFSEPYSGLGYTHVGSGFETLPTHLATGPNALVDWVMVELRDPNDPTTVLKTTTGFIQRDGDVVSVDGSSPVNGWPDVGDHFVALRHRNHLGVMTATPVTLGTGTAFVDFSSPALTTYGTNARKSVSGAFPARVLWPGDVDLSGQVKYAGSNNDREKLLQLIGGSVPTSVANGYHGEDTNLDGQVKYAGSNNDREHILQTIGGNVPTALRTQQLP